MARNSSRLHCSWRTRPEVGNFSVRTYYAVPLGSEEAMSAPHESGRFWIHAVKYF